MQIDLAVIIPTYNREATISRAIASVLYQIDYSVKEIIVEDDGSTDNTFFEIEKLRALSEQKNVNLIVEKTTENRGPSFRRNKGAAKSTTEFIAFLDSDDEWVPNKLQVFANDLKEKSDLTFWGHNFSFENKKAFSSGYLSQVSFWQQMIKNRTQCSCVIFRKKNFLKFREDMRYCEDYEFFTRMSYFYPFYKNSAELTILHRPMNSKGGLSAHIWKMRLGEMRMYLLACKYNAKVYLLLPFLILFSSLKHLRLLVNRI